MPGALQGLAPPDAPNPAPLTGALSGNGSMPPACSSPIQQQQQPPAPTHQQTVATLRHFAALSNQLESALKDPDVGKSDIKGKVIEGMTRLVADRIMPAREAVTQMATFPERPFEQKQWLVNHLQKVLAARSMILTHHAMAFAGQDDQPTPGDETHMDDLSGMMQAHYQRAA